MNKRIGNKELLSSFVDSSCDYLHFVVECFGSSFACFPRSLGSQTLRLPPGFECGFGNHSGRNNLCHRDLCYKLIRDLM